MFVQSGDSVKALLKRQKVAPHAVYIDDMTARIHWWTAVTLFGLVSGVGAACTDDVGDLDTVGDSGPGDMVDGGGAVCTAEYRAGFAGEIPFPSRGAGPIVSGGGVFFVGPQGSLGGHNRVFFLDVEADRENDLSPPEQSFRLVDVRGTRILAATGQELLLVEPDQGAGSVGQGPFKFSFDARDRWLGDSVFGFIKQETRQAVVGFGPDIRVFIDDAVHLTVDGQDAFVISSNDEGVAIDRWSPGTTSPLSNRLATYTEPDVGSYSLAVTNGWVYWRRGEQMWRIERTGGLPQQPQPVPEGDGCIVTDTAADAAVFLCGLHIWDIGQQIRVVYDDGRREDLRLESEWVGAPQLLTDREIVFFAYDTPDALCTPSEAPAGEVRAHDFATGETRTIADVCGPSFCSGAIWQPAWLDAADGVAAWSYPHRTSCREDSFRIGYLSRRCVE